MKRFKEFLQETQKKKRKKSYELKRVRPKKRRHNDTKFGTRKNEGGLAGPYYGYFGGHFSDGGGEVSTDGGSGDGGGMAAEAYYADQSNVSIPYNPSMNPELNVPSAEEVEQENPNKMGLIRRVKNAHLIYKKLTTNGTYEELWIYNTDNTLKDELEIKSNILAGTDIPSNKTTSPDGSQKFDIWTMGNAQLIHITGLPN